MKQKVFATLSILIILSLSACGSAEPTITPQDQAATAMAEAWLVITQTQAALPTSTPIPPTNTPEPTSTFAPTLAPIATIAAIAITPTEQSECDQIPVLEPKGTLVNVEFYNESQGSANFAFGMNSPNDSGECFTYSFSIGNNDAVTAKVLAGCYWGYAWITSGQETSVARSADVLMCLQDTNIIYKVKITKESVNFR